MNNNQFLAILKESFLVYLQTSARSNRKLKILHGAISQDISDRLNDNNYSVYSLGFASGKEHKISGHYVDKAVDITITKNDIIKAGIAVKYVMSNYSQNSNNYFENMLGETANIRSAQIPYFQIFVIADKIPYFDRGGEVTKWETVSTRNLDKYIKLSNESTETLLHTPNKTLVFVIHIRDSVTNAHITNKAEYVDHYLTNDFDMDISSLNIAFGDSVIFNDYDRFIREVLSTI